MTRHIATLFLIAGLGAPPLAAGSIDATDDSLAKVHTGAQVSIDFGVWTYGYNNPGVSPYPTGIGLLVAGTEPAGAALATIPGTTTQYFSGSLMEGWLESLDGSVSVPLDDPNAALLGLPEGSLLVMPATVVAGGAVIDAAVISGSVSMPLATSEALFGSNLGNYNDAAYFRLLNLGTSYFIGLGPGYTVGNSIWEPGIQGLGAAETAGLTGQVVISNPEPSTWLLLGAGLVAMGALLRRRLRLMPAWGRAQRRT